MASNPKLIIASILLLSPGLLSAQDFEASASIKLEQEGSNHEAFLTQDAKGGRTKVKQSGSWQTIETFQAGADSLVDVEQIEGQGNYAAIEQHGAGNIAKTKQVDSTESTIKIAQGANDPSLANSVAASQYGSRESLINTIQQGSNNEIDVV